MIYHANDMNLGLWKAMCTPKNGRVAWTTWPDRNLSRCATLVPEFNARAAMRRAKEFTRLWQHLKIHSERLNAPLK